MTYVVKKILEANLRGSGSETLFFSLQICGFAICGLGHHRNLRTCDLRIKHNKIADSYWILSLMLIRIRVYLLTLMLIRIRIRHFHSGSDPVPDPDPSSQKDPGPQHWRLQICLLSRVNQNINLWTKNLIYMLEGGGGGYVTRLLCLPVYAHSTTAYIERRDQLGVDGWWVMV